MGLQHCDIWPPLIEMHNNLRKCNKYDNIYMGLMSTKCQQPPIKRQKIIRHPENMQTHRCISHSLIRGPGGGSPRWRSGFGGGIYKSVQTEIPKMRIPPRKSESDSGGNLLLLEPQSFEDLRLKGQG